MLVFAAVWAMVAISTANPILSRRRAVLVALVDLARDLELFENAGISLARMLISLLLAAALARPAGPDDGLEPQTG
jgi:ABC-type nitrate/sulfonate/bicarbonate transport system permease component